MNVELISTLLKKMTYEVQPPGSMHDFVPHPVDSQKAVEVAMVFQHRFAFVYWLKWNAEAIRKTGRTKELKSPTNLLTIDWHDDVGGLCDYEHYKKQFNQLNQEDLNEVTMFSWAGLRSLNDGHIEPAAYLNAIGDIYVILKQRTKDRKDGTSERKRSIHDRYGNEHKLYYYDNPKQFLKTHTHDPFAEVHFDLDLDYFLDATDETENESQMLVSDRSIKATVSPAGSLMQWVMPRLSGFTIALEARYCAGLGNCLHALNLVMRTLFEPPFLTENVNWKHLK